MIEDVLELNGLTISILERLSYRSQLGRSLKQNIHYFDREDLFQELTKATEWMAEQSVLDEIALDFRVKSVESIILKYNRNYPNRQARQTFNDLLGFRAFCDDYQELIGSDSAVFRIVDMSGGKANDDGYSFVHLYYQ